MIILFLIGIETATQDIHFSQFKDAPLTLNPALTAKVPFCTCGKL